MQSVYISEFQDLSERNLEERSKVKYPSYDHYLQRSNLENNKPSDIATTHASFIAPKNKENYPMVPRQESLRQVTTQETPSELITKESPKLLNGQFLKRNSLNVSQGNVGNVGNSGVAKFLNMGGSEKVRERERTNSSGSVDLMGKGLTRVNSIDMITVKERKSKRLNYTVKKRMMESNITFKNKFEDKGSLMTSSMMTESSASGSLQSSRLRFNSGNLRNSFGENPMMMKVYNNVGRAEVRKY